MDRRILLVKFLKDKILSEMRKEKEKLKKIMSEKQYNPLNEEYRQCVVDLAALYLLEENACKSDKAFMMLKAANIYELSDETLRIMASSDFNVCLHFIYCIRRDGKGVIFNIRSNLDKYLEENMIDPFERIVFEKYI